MISHCKLTLNTDGATTVLLELVCFPIPQSHYFIVSLLLWPPMPFWAPPCLLSPWPCFLISLEEILHGIRSSFTLSPQQPSKPALTCTSPSLGPPHSLAPVSFFPQKGRPSVDALLALACLCPLAVSPRLLEGWHQIYTCSVMSH